MKKCSLLTIVLISLFFTTCKKKIEEKPAPDTTKSVDDYIKGAPQPVQALASDTIGVGQPVVDKSDKNYVCTIKKVSAGYAFNEQIVMNPQTDVIYPGALLDGNSVVSGAYAPILADRAPMTISTNMDNLVGDKSIVIDKPSLSGVREGVSKLLQKGVDGNTVALMTFKSYDVSSESNLNVALGLSSSASAKIAGNLVAVSSDIKTSLKYGSETKKNKFIFRFIQSYYTIDVDKPNSPKGFFANTVTSAELAKAMPSYTAPVYVASVNYGRAIYVCIQSDYSLKEIESEWDMNVKAAVEVKVVSVTAETTLSAAMKNSKKLNESSLSVTAIGGSAQGASGLVSATKIDEIAKIIVSGANWGKNNPGLPISYKLCRMSDNQAFSVVDYNEFTVRTCQKTYGQVNVAYFKTEYGSDNNVYGTIRATLGYEGEGDKQGIVIWQKGLDQSCSVPEDAMEHSECAFSASEVFNFDPSKKDKMYIRIETSLADRDSETRTGFVDRDDPYDNTSTTIKLSDALQKTDGKGNYIIYFQTTANVTESRGQVNLLPQFLKVILAINTSF